MDTFRKVDGLQGAAENCSLSSALFLDLNIQPADFLIQRGEWDVEMLRGFGLIPVAAFQHVGNDAALDIFDNFEE